MTATTEPAPRIASLDIVRGIAVMGILAMNIVAFAMPFQAYMNPTAFGLDGPADLASWAFSFVFIDGKMRGLFSFLFGASTLLVIERAEAAGLSSARVHYARMLWLLLFGLVHFYFIWFGDILALYAAIGLILYFFHHMSVRALVRTGIILITLSTLFFLGVGAQAIFLAGATAAPDAHPDLVEAWRGMQEGFAPLEGEALSTKLALFAGPWSGLVHSRLIEHWYQPFMSMLFAGTETLAYMLLGMAALRSGFFRGDWPVERYRKWATICLAIALPAYALLALLLIRADFAVEMIFLYTLGLTTPFRPVLVVGYAALIILATRHGGWLVERIAAAGRAAFTNYLGTSILMTTLFYGYGFGLYGSMTRIQLWIPVVAMWALMLLWSKPWLDRFAYGPFEWLWRSLARWQVQPMRRPLPMPAE